jgi:hypothetical protein
MTLKQFDKLKPIIFTNMNGQTYNHYRLVRVGTTFYTLAFLTNDKQVLTMTNKGTARTLEGEIIPMRKGI